MKKLTAIFVVLIIELISLPSLLPAFAQTVCPRGYENLCKIDVAQNPNVVGNIVQLFILFAVVLSVIFLIWGGVRWIMSGGDKGKVEQARSAIIASIVGLIISLLAFFIISLVVYIISGKTDMALPIPKLI